jgi:hypothetical protein
MDCDCRAQRQRLTSSTSIASLPHSSHTGPKRSASSSALCSVISIDSRKSCQP